MTPMAYAWTLFSGPSIFKRQLTWTNDNPFAGSEVYGDVYQVVSVPLYTDDQWKARAEAAEKALLNRILEYGQLSDENLRLRDALTVLADLVESAWPDLAKTPAMVNARDALETKP